MPQYVPIQTAVSGILVAGNVQVEGPVRLIAKLADLVEFRQGEILVARFTDPRWTPLFSRAAGVITE